MSNNPPSTQSHMQNHNVPDYLTPDYNYKYHMVADKHITQNQLLQHNRIFIDPQTGVAYNSYTVSRSCAFASGNNLGIYNADTPIDDDTFIYDCHN